jgi:hypothetical protein
MLTPRSRTTVEKSAQSLAVFCPRHKGMDHIRQVSVVYAEAAPASLRTLPALKSADRLAWTGTVIGLTGAVAIWIGTATHGAVTGATLAIASVCFAYALACYGWAAARRASILRIRRGMPSAMAVWQAGWYCERCDGVFFPPGTSLPAATAPAGAVPGELMTAGDFQHLVWTAGGYDARKVS